MMRKGLRDLLGGLINQNGYIMYQIDPKIDQKILKIHSNKVSQQRRSRKKMSDENIVITKGELFEIVKKRKLETIQEETNGVSPTETDELIIEAEAEKFFVLF